MKKAILIFLLASATLSTSAQQKADKKLTRMIENLVKGFHGDVGVFVQNLKTGKVATYHADGVFPTASMIKVPITAGLMNKVAKKEIDYHSILTYKDSLLYAGEDILGSFKNDEKIALSKVMMLMITISDNTASLWCQSLAGGGEAINELMEQEGLKNTRVNSRTTGRTLDRLKYGWGQTTPREMATLLIKIRNGELISPAVSERIYRNLIRIYFDSQALSQIPPYVQVASKSGAVDEARSEVLLVNAPHGDYVFCITTNQQQDTSWKSNNEGWVLIQSLSKMLWNYFEPKSNWQPAAGIEAFGTNED